MEQWFEKGKKSLKPEDYKEIKDLTKKIFSQKLKELRKASGLTLKELAKLSNTSDSYLSQLENGHRNPPKIDLLNNIAKGLASTPYPIKGAPKTRDILSDFDQTYAALFKSAGYDFKDSDPFSKEEPKETDKFLYSYNNILQDFFLNYSDGTESLDKDEINTPPEFLRFIIYELNFYKNNNASLDFENEKDNLIQLFDRLLTSISENLKR